MRFVSILLVMMVCGITHAQAPVQSYPVNVSRPDNASQFHIVSSVANTPTLKFPLFQETAPYAPTNGWGCYLAFGRSDSDPLMSFIGGTIVGSTAVVQIATNDFPIQLNNWYAAIVLTASVQSVSVRGQITIRRSPEVGGGGILTQGYAINGSLYEIFTGSFSNWPFLVRNGFSYIRYPTNTWTAGYTIFSDNAGTTTYAKATDAGLSGVAITNVTSTDTSIVWTASGVVRNGSVTQYVQNAIGGSGTITGLVGRVGVLEGQTNTLFGLTNQINALSNQVVSVSTGSLSKVTAASTYATSADLVGYSNGLAAVDATKISSVTASSSFYLASNPSAYINGPSWSSFAATQMVNTAGKNINMFYGSGTLRMGSSNIAAFVNAGGGSGADIVFGSSAVGSSVHGGPVSGLFGVYGVGQDLTGYGTINVTIGTNAHSSFTKVYGDNDASVLIGSGSYGSGIIGYYTDNALIQGIGSLMAGYSELNAGGSEIMANGAFQLIYLSDSGQAALTEAGADGSLIVGYGVVTSKYSVVVGGGTGWREGSITAAGGFKGDVSGLTGTLSSAISFPASIATTNIYGTVSNNSNRITLTELYTNRSASALASSVWASADSTTNYVSRVTYNEADSTTNYKSRVAADLQTASFSNSLLAAGVVYSNHVTGATLTSSVNSAISSSGHFSATGGIITGGAMLTSTGTANSSESYHIGLRAISVSGTIETGQVFASHAGGTSLHLYFQPTPLSTAGKVWTDTELDPSIFRTIAAEALYNTNVVKYRSYNSTNVLIALDGTNVFRVTGVLNP